MPHAFSGGTAIVGIGATEFSKTSGRSELQLAVEAVDAALRTRARAVGRRRASLTFTRTPTPRSRSPATSASGT